MLAVNFKYKIYALNINQHTASVILTQLSEVDELFIKLLQTLPTEDWQRPTVARLWTVKDVVAHLLDGNIRVLSMLKDGYFGESPTDFSYDGLVTYLNGLNADWVKAMKRVSPQMLITLHQLTGPLYNQYYASLNPNDMAPFAVSWAGDTESPNWKHIAREYTEKFLHQQQIRDAIGNTELLHSHYFTTFLTVFMLGLPHTYRDIDATNNTVVSVVIAGEFGGNWQIIKTATDWQLYEPQDIEPAAIITIPADISWKLFSKSIRPVDVMNKITIKGDRPLGERALQMVAVMA